MRVEIYQYNEDKILQNAGKLGITPTELVNNIIDSVNIIVKVEVEKIDLNFTMPGLTKAKDKKIVKKAGKNFATDF
jgi:hypothetical protein